MSWRFSHVDKIKIKRLQNVTHTHTPRQSCPRPPTLATFNGNGNGTNDTDRLLPNDSLLTLIAAPLCAACLRLILTESSTHAENSLQIFLWQTFWTGFGEGGVEAFRKVTLRTKSEKHHFYATHLKRFWCGVYTQLHIRIEGYFNCVAMENVCNRQQEAWRNLYKLYIFLISSSRCRHVQ